ncbi:lipocalin family protein [Dyadobacter sp. CY356]|uniref:lipocalin family protein n=1 Tax=Dyadobacter sp. CY356 TaxID=2906442 RepID=UPI001F2427BB|nr:lipocalin family protein [Dyadobacter sp. CY356]MCF0059791.1 lipocalin family protein [Dyadobacter sp. CY356]
MKKIILFTALVSCMLTACNKESGSISGSWVRSMDEQPQHKQGFTLKDEGNAASINLNDKLYHKWEKFGDLLILRGTKNSEAKEEFSDTLKIVSVSDSILVLKKTDGNEITYTKTNVPGKLVRAFETFDCYTFSAKKDTAILHINVVENMVSGNLEYRFFEKDRNNGTIKGKMFGDTLIADYTFLSEGSTSAREVVMIKKDNNFIEGFGDVQELDNKVSFINRAKLSFKNGLTFKKSNCP